MITIDFEKLKALVELASVLDIVEHQEFGIGKYKADPLITEFEMIIEEYNDHKRRNNKRM